MEIQSFLELLEDSKLLSDDQATQLPELCAHYPKPEALAGVLVEYTWITQWQADTLLSGERAVMLGRYRAIRLIGENGTEVGFETHQPEVKRPVTVRTDGSDFYSKPDLTQPKREVKAAADLVRHPNILCASEADSVEGIDLQALVTSTGPVSEKWACEFVRQAALGLQHAHEQSMVHRDIKPVNLLLTTNAAGFSEVKIMRLGLPRFTSEVEAHERRSGREAASLVDYISPEQSNDSNSGDIRSDIFSLGCSLFFLLTGEPPYPGKGPVERVMNRVMKAAPRVRSVRPVISGTVDDIIAKMLERQPKQRFQTPQEVANVLGIIAGSIGNTAFEIRLE